jgi:membrane protease YdiL (CAAX protease family)
MSLEIVVLSKELNDAASPTARFRNAAARFISRHKGVALVELLILALIFAAPLFTFSSGILGIAFVLLMLWLRKSKIRDLGLRRPSSWLKTLTLGVVAVILILTIQALLVQPLLRLVFSQPPNFSRFHNMSLYQLLGWIAAGWAMGGFVEELIRAYLILRIVELLGYSRAGWIIALLGSSFFYALNHTYQGFAGAIGAIISCIGFGALYLLNKRNLWSNVICHGLNDTLAFIAVFMGSLN